MARTIAKETSRVRRNGKVSGRAIGFTDIAIDESSEHRIRFTSGQMIYVESMHENRWAGRFWSADGRINVPYESWAEDAFQLSIDRQRLTTGWSFVAAYEADKTSRNEAFRRNASHFIVELNNAEHLIDVKVHTLLDGTPVLTRWIEITNRSDQPAALTEVYPWSGKLWPGQNFTAGYYTQDIWACEGWFEWQKLPAGMTHIHCDKGQGFDDPFFIVRSETAGEYFIGHLAWSANWAIDFNRDKDGLKLKIGPTAVNPQRVIAAGETIAAPAVHLGHVSGNFDTAVQAMHDHLRRSVLPQRADDRNCLMQYLVPADQGYYKPFNEDSAMKCVDVAAAIGTELFILDAYWWDITPDWTPSAERFPNGLEPLIEYVHKKGMLFGLYLETEAGRGQISASRIYKEHPEWFGPNDILNLTIPEAAAWMEAETIRLIETYQLDLFRLDYNPFFTYEGPTTLRNGPAGRPPIVENNYWRYYEVFYDLYERLQAKYPKLILQQCAAGGARNDLGTASRFHETYLTDGLSIPRELQIYSGLTLGLPPEIFVILHGADGGIGMGKPNNLDTILRLTYTLSTPQVFVGTVAPSVAELTPQRRERFRHYAKLYKQFIRPALPTCRLYHHEPINAHGGVESSPWFAVEFGAPDRSKGWATIIRMRNGPGDTFVHKYGNEVVHDQPVARDSVEYNGVAYNSAAYNGDTYLFKPRGLNPAKTYRLTFDSLGTPATVDGLRLMQEGVPVRLENAGMSELLLFEAID